MTVEGGWRIVFEVLAKRKHFAVDASRARTQS